MPDRLTTRLRRLLGARPKPLDRNADRARREVLERKLLAEHLRRHPNKPRRAKPAGFGLATRLALASMAVTAVLVAACQLPADVELELGRRIVFAIPVADGSERRIDAVAEALRIETGAETIEVRVRQERDQPELQVTLDVWGRALDPGAVEQVLADHDIAHDGVEDLALAGVVRTTWGDRLGHELFNLDLDLDALDVDEARRAILAELEAQGFVGEAEVEVEDDDGRRRVEIRLRATEP